jgi:hypothetical protein
VDTFPAQLGFWIGQQALLHAPLPREEILKSSNAHRGEASLEVRETLA